MSKLRVERWTDAAAFAEQVGPFLRRAAPLYDLQLGLIRLLEADPSQASAALLAAAYDDADEMLGVFLQFGHRKPVLTRMPDHVAHAFAEILALSERPVPAVTGPPEAVHAFATKYAQLCGVECVDGSPMGLYRLERVNPPKPAPGRLVLAGTEHLAVAADFDIGFRRDVHMHDPMGDPHENAKRRIGDRKLYFWLDLQGLPVSVALRNRETDETAAISFVYTPSEQRGRGYASNCVASLCQLLLDEGKRYCTLFAELSNATSTGIYTAIGFEQVGETAEVLFRRE